MSKLNLAIYSCALTHAFTLRRLHAPRFDAPRFDASGRQQPTDVRRRHVRRHVRRRRVLRSRHAHPRSRRYGNHPKRRGHPIPSRNGHPIPSHPIPNQTRGANRRRSKSNRYPSPSNPGPNSNPGRATPESPLRAPGAGFGPLAPRQGQRVAAGEAVGPGLVGPGAVEAGPARLEVVRRADRASGCSRTAPAGSGCATHCRGSTSPR